MGEGVGKLLLVDKSEVKPFKNALSDDAPKLKVLMFLLYLPCENDCVPLESREKCCSYSILFSACVFRVAFYSLRISSCRISSKVRCPAEGACKQLMELFCVLLVETRAS